MKACQMVFISDHFTITVKDRMTKTTQHMHIHMKKNHFFFYLLLLFQEKNNRLV